MPIPAALNADRIVFWTFNWGRYFVYLYNTCKMKYLMLSNFKPVLAALETLVQLLKMLNFCCTLQSAINLGPLFWLQRYRKSNQPWSHLLPTGKKSIGVGQQIELKSHKISWLSFGIAFASFSRFIEHYLSKMSIIFWTSNIFHHGGLNTG